MRRCCGEKLIRDERGERVVWRVMRVPDAQWGRENSLSERTHHRNQLVQQVGGGVQGIRLTLGEDLVGHLEEVETIRR